MSYTALYRKFRPTRFDEVVGQEHITKTLKNQIINNRVGHAYLFNGGRGTGKTSSAKILARAINCLNPQNGEPCNECEICKQIINGSLTDVVEMDAASNNSVEDIRLIRDEVNFLPTIAKYRVYIIDEVHMLSTGAFNALLKTLEEPPEHVKFILATTEPQKLPATILSRCQRFDFKQISEKDIQKRLEIICNQSKIKITEKALLLIAELSEGAMRDGISILERCIQDGIEEIKEENIRELAGIPEITYINQTVEAIIECNFEKAIQIVNSVLNEGKDINHFLWEMIKYIKDVLLYKTTNTLKIYNEAEIAEINKISNKTTKEKLLELIYQFSELDNVLKWSTQKQLMFQVGMIKACNKNENTNVEEIKRKIIELENRLNETIEQKRNLNEAGRNSYVEKQNKINTELNQQEEKIILDEMGVQDKSECKNWGKVLESLKKSGKMIIYTNLINTTAREMNDMTIGVEFKGSLTEFGRRVLEQAENRKELEKIVSIQYGKEMNIKFLTKESGNAKKEPENTREVGNNFDIPINIIDE